MIGKPEKAESSASAVNITVRFTYAEWEEVKAAVEMHKRKTLSQDECVSIVIASCRERTLSHARLMRQYEQTLFEGL